MRKKVREDAIFLDAKGLEQLNNEIVKTQEKINNLLKQVGEFRNNGIDSTEYQSLRIDIEREKAILRGFLEARKKVVIVEKQYDENVVNIGDIVEIIDVTANAQREGIGEYKFKLVAGNGNFDTEIPEISINSPVGKAVYNKNVGDTVSYKVENFKFDVQILSSRNLELEDSAPGRK